MSSTTTPTINIPIPNNSRYAKLRRVIDGDTFECDIKVDKDIVVRETIRLNNFDAPESWRPKTKSEKKHGLEAKAYTKQLLKQASQVIIETVKKDGKYGRRIANVYMDCRSNLGNDRTVQSSTNWVGFKSLATLLIEADLAKRSKYLD